MRGPLVILVAFALAGELRATALADQQRYSVSGTDSFVIGAGDIRNDTSYAGTQTLTTTHQGKTTRYAAKLTYVRTEQGTDTSATGGYVSDMLPSGEQLDSSDTDPDYLTVLNQPFSVQLDRATVADLRGLKGTLPFDVPSPITGSPLHGRLERCPGGSIGPRRTVGVKFEAGGPMRGALPDRPGLVLIGTIVMRGTAYYDNDTALLLALDATVTIKGKLSNRNGADPVTIVYHRTIRAQEPTRATTARTSAPLQH